jgi:hypothetical protein
MKACHECVGTNGMINVRGIGPMIGIEFDNKKEEIRKSLIIQELAPIGLGTVNRDLQYLGGHATYITFVVLNDHHNSRVKSIWKTTRTPEATNMTHLLLFDSSK